MNTVTGSLALWVVLGGLGCAAGREAQPSRNPGACAREPTGSPGVAKAPSASIEPSNVAAPRSPAIVPESAAAPSEIQRNAPEPYVAQGLMGVSEPRENEPNEHHDTGFGPPQGSVASFGMVNLTEASGDTSSTQQSSVQVRMGAVQVRGTQPPEVVVRILRQNYGNYRACYQKAFGPNAQTEGTVELLFDIDGNGVVSNARVGTSTLRDPKFSQCLLSGLHQLAFPTAQGSSTVQFRPTFHPVDKQRAKHD
jgi:hypothetical protein